MNIPAPGLPYFGAIAQNGCKEASSTGIGISCLEILLTEWTTFSKSPHTD
jgi:hypothetical protein